MKNTIALNPNSVILNCCKMSIGIVVILIISNDIIKILVTIITNNKFSNLLISL